MAAHTLSPAEYQELGKSYYKKKEYQKAVDAFSSGIHASVIPTVTLYDYRAAAHEKMGDFNTAVKDGREAIRLDKKDVKGYLRTGSALQKLNKPETAVSIYKYGMKNVPVDNKNFQLLQQLHDKLTRQLAPPTAIDPFTVLPMELVEMILGYLPFKNVVNCLRVSKGWKSYLTKRPKLWQNIDLSFATKPVSRVFVRHAVQWSENAVVSLTVHRFQHADVLRNIATACKSLHTIEIISLPFMLSETLIEVAQCAANLKKFVVHTDMTPDTAAQILRYRPTLEHVAFTSILGQVQAECKGPFPKLHTLQLGVRTNSIRDLDAPFVKDIIGQTPALQVLNLHQWVMRGSAIEEDLFTQPLTTLILQAVDVAIFPRLPSTIKRFVFHPKRPFALPLGPLFDDENESWDNAQLSDTRHLEHLTIKEVLNLSPQFLGGLLDVYKDEIGTPLKGMEDAEDLKSLSLNGQLSTTMRLFGGTGLCGSPRMVTNSLTSLAVSAMPCTDDDIETLLTHATNIQTIEVDSTRITGAGVKMLVDGLPNLRYIRADHCQNITSRDAVAYAEKRRIGVSCKMTDALGGKKVRYGLF
ncbi:hypothetical protein K458DRAFT_344425 [Lentithecium fluviatile CBS 122367]|uniref:F-box domain-containing protein n=1 Tax=Lentithecium fluviatile CBS 122367 TaxID=1168545 RepID=A0A6G1IT63_9PLEO|nr:hypothetical protein K458DRAFT_344425 [Lentithecium fluviatile CBS 122367]